VGTRPRPDIRDDRPLRLALVVITAVAASACGSDGTGTPPTVPSATV
jgi:hypothetical protein